MMKNIMSTPRLRCLVRIGQDVKITSTMVFIIGANPYLHIITRMYQKIETGRREA